jgi:DNA polymerase-3 subunit gamma/tau
LLDVGNDELVELEQWAAQADAGLLLHWTRIFSGLDHQLRTSTYGHLPLELAVVEAMVGTPQVAAAPAPTLRPAAPVRPAPTPPRPSVVRPAVAQPTAAPAPELPVNPPVPAEPVAAPPSGDPSDILTHHETPVATQHAASIGSAPKIPFDEEAARAANADISTFEQVEALWPQVVRDVRPFSTTVQALLKDVRPIDVEGNTIVLLATSRFHKEKLEQHANRQIVEDVIKKRFGSVFAIRCTTETRTETRDLRGQIREARKDALVKAAMNIFEADIVDIEPEQGIRD